MNMRQGSYFSLLLKSVPLATWLPDILNVDFFLRCHYLVVQALRRKIDKKTSIHAPNVGKNRQKVWETRIKIMISLVCIYNLKVLRKLRIFLRHRTTVSW